MQAEPGIDECMGHVRARQQLHTRVLQVTRAIETEVAAYDDRIRGHGWRRRVHPSCLHDPGNVLRQFGMCARAVESVRVGLIDDEGRSDPGMIAYKRRDYRSAV